MVVEHGPDGRHKGMTEEEMDAVTRLHGLMSGWLYDLTAQNASVAETAQARLNECAKVFTDFTDAQKAHFLKKFRLNPADLLTAKAILIALGLVKAVDAD